MSYNILTADSGLWYNYRMIYKLIPTKQEFERLFSYSDDYDPSNSFINDLYSKGVFWMIAYSIITVGSLLFITLTIYNPIPNQSVLFIIVATLWLFSSYQINKYSFHNGEGIILNLLTNFSKQISDYLPNKEKSVLNSLSASLGTFTLTVSNSFSTLINLVVFSVALFFILTESLTIWIAIVITTLTLYTIITVVGYQFSKSLKSVSNSLIADSKINQNQLNKRLIIPAVFNLSPLFTPLFLLILRTERFNPLAVLMVTTLLSYTHVYWKMLENTSKVVIGKRNLVEITESLEKISRKYVINNAGFKKLSALCKPSKTTLTQSAKNRSFIIKNFVPMQYENRQQITHIFDHEFLCAKMYQINGLNGVGKTTLLQSISLPEGIRVQFSKGELAYKGALFFDKSIDLKSHRKGIVYIGGESQQEKYKKINRLLFRKYPAISQTVDEIFRQKKEKLSEGEKAIVNLLVAISAVNKDRARLKLLILDEVVSRIYEDEEVKTRTEFINIVNMWTKKLDIVTIVIDHMSRVEGAQQLFMRRNGVTKLSEQV